MTLWPEMHVRPIWLTMSMLGGRSIAKMVETQMLGRLYKILGDNMTEHAEILRQQKYEEHVEFIEEYFVGCEVQFGLQNAEVQAAAEQLALTSNIFAIKELLRGKYQAALKLFKKAELLTDPHKYRYRRRGDLRAWTFDNIAYYYYRRSKFSASLQYVQKAAKVHHATARQATGGTNETRSYGVILSHMATIYTKLGRHDYSLDYGRRALELVTANDGNAADDASAAVCYHNIAVEHVFMFSYKDAVGVQVTYSPSKNGNAHVFILSVLSTPLPPLRCANIRMRRRYVFCG
jgi:tetratricopeptide (TPR) repeat protein